MLDFAKRIIHRVFRMFGFEIMSVKNIDAALDERENQRKEQYIKWLSVVKSGVGDSEYVPSVEQIKDSDVSITYVDAKDISRVACARLEKVKVVLDIGCAMNPQPYVNADIHICCEPYAEYMNRLIHEHKDEDKFVFLNCGLEEAVNLFPYESVDTACLIDVIEHLKKEAALECLNGLKKIVRCQIVIFTPLGFMSQEYSSGEQDQWGMKGSEWQKHRSGWGPEDFPANEGWEIIACKEYHSKDAKGGDLEKPIGAMWAIWNRR